MNFLIKQGGGEPPSKLFNKCQIEHSRIDDQTIISAKRLNQIEYNRKDPPRERICWVSYLLSSTEINPDIRPPSGGRTVRRLIGIPSECRLT